MDDQDIKLFIIGRCVGAEALETLNVIFESVFDVGLVRCESLRLIELVQKLENEISKPRFIEALSKCLADKITRLLLIHFDFTK